MKVHVVVQHVPVVLARVARVPAPLEVSLTDFALDNVLYHATREQAVELSLEEGQIERRPFLRLHRIEEDRLLVGLAPTVRPVVHDARHLHSTNVQSHFHIVGGVGLVILR